MLIWASNVKAGRPLVFLTTKLKELYAFLVIAPLYHASISVLLNLILYFCLSQNYTAYFTYLRNKKLHALYVFQILGRRQHRHIFLKIILKQTDSYIILPS